jgi:hypothetical protein
MYPIHHKLTINKPRSAPRICQNPQQKRGRTSPKKNYRNSVPSSGRVLASSGDGDGSHVVSVFEVEDLGAPDLRKLSDCGEAPDAPNLSATKFSLQNAASPNSLILWGFSRVFWVAKAENKHT